MEILVMIPTYNEAGNIENVIKDILILPFDIQILVVDDNSPDKTFEIVSRLSEKDKRIHILLRKEDRGRGWAGIDGFKKAIGLGAKYIVEMDGDGSHSPKFIPSMFDKISNTDIVIGSRYVAGGKDEQRTILRRTISAFARKYLSFILGIRVFDPTSGFRMFTKNALKLIVPYLKARDPFIVTEVLFYAKKLNLKITETPIDFMPRITGESKLKPVTLIKYLLKVFKLRFL